MQMNLFEDPTDPIWMEYRALESKQENLRRGIFRRYDEMLTIIEELQKEVQCLKKQESDPRQPSLFA